MQKLSSAPQGHPSPDQTSNPGPDHDLRQENAQLRLQLGRTTELLQTALDHLTMATARLEKGTVQLRESVSQHRDLLDEYQRVSNKYQALGNKYLDVAEQQVALIALLTWLELKTAGGTLQ